MLCAPAVHSPSGAARLKTSHKEFFCLKKKKKAFECWFLRGIFHHKLISGSGVKIRNPKKQFGEFRDKRSPARWMETVLKLDSTGLVCSVLLREQCPAREGSFF